MLNTARTNCLMATAMAAGLWPVYLVPILMGILQRYLGYSVGDAAIIGSAELAATAVTVVVMGRFRSIGSFRPLISIAAVLAVVANLASTLGLQFAAMLAARLVAGFGSGLFLGTATMSLARQVEPGRVIGRVLSLSAVFLTVSMLMIPMSVNRWGSPAYFLISTIVALAPLSTASLLRALEPAEAARNSTHEGVEGTNVGIRMRFLMIMIMAGLFFPIGGIWAVADEIALTHGLSLQATGIALSVSNIAGVVGGELSRRTSGTSGIFPPVSLTAIGLVLVAFGVCAASTTLTFSLVMGSLGVIYVFINSHLVGVAAVVDRSGGMSAQLNGASLIAISIGTELYGFLLANGGGIAIEVGTGALSILVIGAAAGVSLMTAPTAAATRAAKPV